MLAAKIAAAAAAVGGRLKADKRNREQGYDYISADTILATAGQALAEQGVALFPAIVEHAVDVTTYRNKRGEDAMRYDARVTFVMRLSADDESVELAWVGMGSDYGVPDKALYKAITSGHKYFLAKLLCIGEGNEDGEHEPVEEPIAPTAPTVGAQPKCPICGSDMYDNRAKVAETGKGPEWVCKQAGKWDPATKSRTGCPGVYWPGEWPPASTDDQFNALPSASAERAHSQPARPTAPGSQASKGPALAVNRAGPRYAQLAAALAKEHPAYQNKHGVFDDGHIRASLASIGIAEITPDNLDEAFRRLAQHALSKEADEAAAAATAAE